MTYTLFNPSATDYGRSADNVLAQMLSTGATLALVRDSSKLTALCASVGMRVIFRAAGDDPAGDPVGRNDPVGFINSRVDAAPQATWIHGTNEVGFSAQLDAYTRELARTAEARGKRIVAYNAATNQDLRQWKASEPTIRWLMERGHKIGAHLYLDGNPEHDAGGYAPLDWLKSIGAPVFVTEYAYIHSIFDANVGYRADMDAGQYAGWHDDHAPRMAAYGYPLFHFSLSHWNDDEAGRRVGFGTEDRPEIDAHFAVLNAKYPILESVPVPLPPPASYPPGEYRLARIPGTYVNVRALPNAVSADLGDLRVGDKVILTGMASGDWVLLTAPDGKRGWTSLQGGSVAFTPVETKPPPAVGKIIDISSNNGKIDWKAARADGVDIAILRATMGAAGVDASLRFNFSGAFAQGAGIWFYHLFRPDSDGVSQAYHYLNTTRPLAHKTRLCVDVESVTEPKRILSKSQYADQLATFVNILKSETGELPTLYTSWGEWGKLVGRQHDALFAQCPLWIANYTARPAPTLARCWQTYDLWQYTSSGRVAGIPSRVDLNRRKP